MAFFFRGRKLRRESSGAVPGHIAIIMDGNGRWAKRRGLPRAAGHAAGAETFRRVATRCKDIGVGYLTVYAFSTENWKRPPEEVDAILELLDKYLREALEKMERDDVRLRVFGDTSALTDRLRALIGDTDEISRRTAGMQVNVCVNYGGRAELLRAASLYAGDLAKGEARELSEESFRNYLFSAGVPDPDLVIRTGGEKRLSNFLLWQAAYAELYFTDVLWPDFDERTLDRAIADYAGRIRRYGGVDA
ncbi:MAG: di-trans,poly-cis-decaprenylcistransferase [Oscillospiraceae bacterium]|jgi:undecaprenyl diphosphate synthase|nr:di-trans,poly-cis-decaprenylcistransferase [Oscillospiraceae bacterium]